MDDGIDDTFVGGFGRGERLKALLFARIAKSNGRTDRDSAQLRRLEPAGLSLIGCSDQSSRGIVAIAAYLDRRKLYRFSEGDKVVCRKECR